MNIVTTKEAEDFLGLPSGSGGDFLRTVIEDVSAMLAEVTGRSGWGPQEERTEYKDGGLPWVTTKYWPIQTVEVRDDVDHNWDADSVVESTDYWVDKDGIIWLEGAIFVEGFRTVRVVYTGGYANEAAIPQKVKTWGLRQIEHTWNARQRPGQNITSDFEGIGRSEILPEVMRGLKEFTRRVPFA